MYYHDSRKIFIEDAASDPSLPQKILVVSPLYMIMDIMTSPVKILLQNYAFLRRNDNDRSVRMITIVPYLNPLPKPSRTHHPTLTYSAPSSP